MIVSFLCSVEVSSTTRSPRTYGAFECARASLRRQSRRCCASLNAIAAGGSSSNLESRTTGPGSCETERRHFVARCVMRDGWVCRGSTPLGGLRTSYTRCSFVCSSGTWGTYPSIRRREGWMSSCRAQETSAGRHRSTVCAVILTNRYHRPRILLRSCPTTS